MALESGITLYDQIKAKLKGGGVQKDPGFFDFGTVSLGPAPAGTFEEPTYYSTAVPPGMVSEQMGPTAGQVDYSKGIDPRGFYKDVAVDVGMRALTAPEGTAKYTVNRTQAYDDLQAASMLGIAPPETPEDYKNLDAIMANLGYTGSFDYGRSLGPAGSIGFTKTTEAGRQAQSFVSSIMGPLGVVIDASTGDQYVGLGGLEEFDPFNLPGILTERNQRQVYDIAKMEARGIPGFDAYVGKDGQLKGIRPSEGITKLFGQEYSVVGGMGTIDDARNELAIGQGLDPLSYDFSTGTGTELEGFVSGFGGFSTDGSFVNMSGERATSMNHGYTGMEYGSAVADVYGQDYAVQMMQDQAQNIANSGGFFSSSRANYYNSIADQIAQGVRVDYAFGSGKDKYTGGYVRTAQGKPVRTTSGFVYSGQKVSEDRSNAGDFTGSGAFGTAANKAEAVEASRSSSAYGFGD